MECADIPIERSSKGYIFWDFAGTTKIGAEEVTYRESFPIWLVGPLFKALGFKEVSPGKFDVEPTEALGRKFKCDIVHEEINGKPYARMKNMIPIINEEEADIPF